MINSGARRKNVGGGQRVKPAEIATNEWLVVTLIWTRNGLA